LRLCLYFVFSPHRLLTDLGLRADKALPAAPSPWQELPGQAETFAAGTRMGDHANSTETLGGHTLASGTQEPLTASARAVLVPDPHAPRVWEGAAGTREGAAPADHPAHPALPAHPAHPALAPCVLAGSSSSLGRSAPGLSALCTLGNTSLLPRFFLFWRALSLSMDRACVRIVMCIHMTHTHIYACAAHVFPRLSSRLTPARLLFSP